MQMDSTRQQPVRVRGIGVKLDQVRNTAQPPIVELLRESIRLGMLEPGKPLIQASIAKAMGVSRIPVREALFTLAAEGLVTFGEDGSAHVTALAPEEVNELWELRNLLESHMASGIVRTATPADIAALREIVDAMDDLNGPAWSDSNFTFHKELHRLSDMPQVADAAGRVLTKAEPYSRRAVSVLHVEGGGNVNHRKMVDALAAGDDAELARLLLHHHERASAALLEYFATMTPPVDQKANVTETARSLADHLNA